MANGDNSDTSLEDNSEAAMTLAVKSRDVLEMTVTKTCLDVFTKLGAVSILAMLQLWQSHRWNCRLSVLPPTFKPVLEQIRLLQVAGIPTSDWIKLYHAGVTPYTRVTSFFENKCALGWSLIQILLQKYNYFLQHILATYSNLICCKSRQVWFVGGKTRDIAIQLV